MRDGVVGQNKECAYPIPSPPKKVSKRHVRLNSRVREAPLVEETRHPCQVKGLACRHGLDADAGHALLWFGVAVDYCMIACHAMPQPHYITSKSHHDKTPNRTTRKRTWTSTLKWKSGLPVVVPRATCTTLAQTPTEYTGGSYGIPPGWGGGVNANGNRMKAWMNE